MEENKWKYKRRSKSKYCLLNLSSKHITHLSKFYKMSQIWFVTGVSSGLGFETAIKALEAGFKVIGTVRSRQRAAKEVQEIESRGGKCLELDVTNADACFDVFAEAERLHGRIDVLINNAGMSYLGAVEDFS